MWPKCVLVLDLQDCRQTIWWYVAIVCFSARSPGLQENLGSLQWKAMMCDYCLESTIAAKTTTHAWGCVRVGCWDSTGLPRFTMAHITMIHFYDGSVLLPLNPLLRSKSTFTMAPTGRQSCAAHNTARLPPLHPDYEFKSEWRAAQISAIEVMKDRDPNPKRSEEVAKNLLQSVKIYQHIYDDKQNRAKQVPITSYFSPSASRSPTPSTSGYQG